MTAEALLARWEGQTLAHWRERWAVPDLRIFEQVGSTNDVLRAAAGQGAPAGTVAIADFQSSGRGRLGRRWEAPPGQALLMSVLLRPDAAGTAAAAGTLPLRVGLAIAGAIQQLTALTPALKWPNDVQVSGRKLAGVLCEAGADWVVAGCGINVGQTEAELAPEIRGQATSLRQLTPVPPARAELAGAILERLAPWFSSPHRALGEDELARYAALDALAGREILVDDQPAGRAVGITELGSLKVERGGELLLVHAGTVRSAP